MIEVLWHGRGGQGAFTAARLLGAASSLSEGRYALAFPSFGPERRGAPMRAFTKLDDAPIGDRSAVAQADYVVYLDDTLLGDDWADELKPGGTVLVNSALAYDDDRIRAIDADGMSAAVLGRPIPNTVFLGAISALCEHVHADDVKEAVRQYMPVKLHEKNIALVDAARELLQEHDNADAPTREPGTIGEEACGGVRGAGSAALSAAASDGATLGVAARGADRPTGLKGAAEPPRPGSPVIPRLHGVAPQPEDYARSTCYEAGFLVERNAGWRNSRPVVDRAACTGCLECYMHCPDGTIYKIAPGGADDAEGQRSAGEQAARRKRPLMLVAVDYDFCKGCGVCVKVCRFDAIAMVSEREALAGERAAAVASTGERAGAASTAVEDSAAAAGDSSAPGADEQRKEALA